MMFFVYSVRDNHVGFGSPFVESNDYAARRGFTMAMKNPGSLMEFSPADFALYKVGTFDSETGKMDPIWPVELLLEGVNAHG